MIGERTRRPMDENPKLKELGDLCVRSLKFLCMQFLGYQDWDDAVHRDVQIALVHPAKKKAMLLPRGHLKSSIVTVGYTIQQICKNPNIRILIANQIWDQSRRFLSEIKGHLETSQLKHLFGEFVSSKWNQDDIIVKQRTKAQASPTVMTTGVEAEQTGSHFDLVILDDLTGLQNSQTPEQREKTKRFRRSMINLLDPGGTLIEVGTRWHLDDTFAEILEKEAKYYYIVKRQVIEDGKIIFTKHFSKRFDRARKDWVSVPGENCMDYISHLKESMPLDEFNCTPAETPILMANWKTKPIEHVKVGDEIVGYTLGEGRKNGSLVKTRVKRTFSKQDHVLRLVMKSGRTVLCTKDHRWYTGRANDPQHSAYAPAQVGSKLRFVCPVEQKPMAANELMDWSYLAGIFDGEGSTKSGGCMTLSQCHSKNPGVYAEIVNVMDRLNIRYGMGVRREGNFDGRNHSPGNTSFWMKDSFGVGLSLIRNTSLGKASQIADRFFKFGKKFVREKDEVLDIKYDSMRTVYALETETGNYIAWGYASSNSQYMNEPLSSETQLFKPEMFKYWNQKPEGLHIGMAIDLAISQARTADSTAIVVMGMDSKWNLYVLDYLVGKWKPQDIINNVFDMKHRWKPQAVGMETNGFQKTLKLGCEEEMRRRKDYFPIDEIRTGPDKTKENRIKSLEPFYRSGSVQHAAWMKGKEMEIELQTFPKGRHDDIIDAMSMCLPLLHAGSETVRQAVPEGSWEWYFRKSQESGMGYSGFFGGGQ